MTSSPTRLRTLDRSGSSVWSDLHPAAAPPPPGSAPRTRRAFAAAHVVPVAWGENVPGAPASIDWDSTLGFRRHLWALGLGVADAMDTAQRNMGLDWGATQELIRRSADAARDVDGALVVGVNTDQLTEPAPSLDRVVDAYREQLDIAQDAGAGVVLMASRHLARAAATGADYERAYAAVLAAAGRPVILHWLGEAFDPELSGYFGSSRVTEAMHTVVRIIEADLDRVEGIKVSLLDVRAERALRAALPPGVRVYTGDDYHFVDLIQGELDRDGVHRHSDALLGAFAAAAPNAARALVALDGGDVAEYRRILEPTQVLARHVFASPTPYYKTGVAFLSWLNGHQPAFSMVGGLHAGRSLVHLGEIVRLANEADALEDPELAASRWSALLAVNGVER